MRALMYQLSDNSRVATQAEAVASKLPYRTILVEMDEVKADIPSKRKAILDSGRCVIPCR